ncbi:hypothetical protein AQUCO_00900403v1 [Aquilegia coerulea]|uniref:Uncharacterized protein n=1 Tax=Aquilegia coerulea TaxID=218851 RepID=A0A2G5EDF0_AQUCA|nr:hypothetical protein AQUCO_00900403v1 [Aquilegia coerulea]
MPTYLWKRYAAYLHTKWEKRYLWGSTEHYRHPKMFTPVVVLFACAFYTGVVGAAITEQLHKEKYWELEEHPGEAVPMMKPKNYCGPWKVRMEDHFQTNQ